MITEYQLLSVIQYAEALPEGLLDAVRDDNLKSALRSYQMAIDLLRTSQTAIKGYLDHFGYLPIDGVDGE